MNEGRKDCREGSTISEISERRKLKSYYFTHVDAHVAHTRTFTQTQPDSEAFEWLSQMGFFFHL